MARRRPQEAGRLDLAEEGRTIGQAAIQFILHEPAVASCCPTSTTWPASKTSRPTTAPVRSPTAEYARVQGLYAENFSLPQPTPA